MSKQVWIDPNNSKNKVYVDSHFAPATSPAPSGNPTVPAGYLLQLGWDGYMDTGSYYISGAAQSRIAIAGLPYYVGTPAGVIGADPLAGQPFHAPPSYNSNLGIID